MRIRLLLSAWCGALMVSTAQADTPPTRQQVQAWWKAKPTEEMTIDGPLQEVHLLDKEVAFLAPVGFYGRGRNFIRHAMLIRPRLQEVRELAAPFGHTFSVQDIDEDGVSEIVSDDVASGQGSTDHFRSIVRLDGFTSVVLHAAVGEHNLGNCHDGCEQVDAEWKFRHAAGDEVTVLTEIVTTGTGPGNSDHLKSRVETRCYLLYGNTFVRADARWLRPACQLGTARAQRSR